MFKRENSYYMPFMVSSGQVFYEKFFDDLECEQLTMRMLNTLTVAELLDLRVKLGGIPYFEKSDGKKVITERMLRGWELNLERFNDNKVEENDTNSLTMMPEDELSDASGDISDDGILNITDYINIPDEPWECRLFSKDYLEDEADFITLLHIVLNKHTGEHLLDLNLYDQTISVFDLKDWMVQKFATMTKDGNPPFPTCAFRLGCGSRLLRDDETVADVAQGESRIVLKLLLVLRGGGIPVQRLEKTKAKVENSKKSLSVCASKVGEDVKTVPVVKKIGDVVQGFLVSLDTHGAQQTLLKYMTDLAKTEPQKATEIVKYLEQSTAGSPEVKMRHIAGKFFGCEGISEKIEELKMADESLKFALLLGFQRMICENKSKKEYTISSFGEALDTVLKMSDDVML